MSALHVADLRISFGGRPVVAGLDLEVARGECVAIVGESGAGKSLTARALLGLLPADAEVVATALEVDGIDARGLDERGWRHLRGARIGLVSQDALVSLDPLRRIGAEIAEPVRLHEPRLARTERTRRVRTLLDDVAMPEPERRVRQHPHELSGGLRQRALIASALAARPAILVADEPTTALDATVQARILSLLRDVVARGTAVVFITHDLAAVRRVADRIVVMRAGEVVETGTAAQVLSDPSHPYTRELLAATEHAVRAPVEPGSAPVVVEVEGVSKAFDRPAVRDASVTVRRGRTLGIVGESGSGKTTLARVLVGVERPDAGTVRLHGRDRSALSGAEARRIQLVHQNPLGAFDPRWRVGRSLLEALAAGGVARAERESRMRELFQAVDLDPALASRRPHELSGGQRQRAAIARALAAAPDVLVLDEPVSALDPSVREKVLSLLTRLQGDHDLTMVLISHDLDVVAAIADEVVVMQDGAIVDRGPTARVFAAPEHPFTRELLAAAGRGG